MWYRDHVFIAMTRASPDALLLQQYYLGNRCEIIRQGLSNYRGNFGLIVPKSDMVNMTVGALILSREYHFRPRDDDGKSTSDSDSITGCRFIPPVAHSILGGAPPHRWQESIVAKLSFGNQVD